MENLYLDNYRGFSNQYIEIRDVNFLVGENSAGKSSALLAIKTLYSENFWSEHDFSASDVGYSFEDCVSVAAREKSYFRLGYIFDRNDKTSFLFEFANDGGKPVLSRAIISFGEITFYFVIEYPAPTMPITEMLRTKQIMQTKFDETNVFYHIQKRKLTNFDAFQTDWTDWDWKKLESANTKTGVVPFTLLRACLFDENDQAHDKFPTPDQSIDFIAPIRSKPRKTYDEPATPASSDGGHIPYLLRQLLSKNGVALRNSLNDFGKQSGLFDDIEIKEYGAGFDDAPFRLNFLLDKIPINIVNLGYGVSQVFPVLFNIFTGKDDVFEIQQPEVHLHPRAQAALGNVFFNISIENHEKKFFIETHSDYLIDRFRQCQKKSEKKSSAQVLFFTRTNGLNKAQSIAIDQNGNYPNDQPSQFRDFFLTEAMENLGLC
jgi:hypothetical protein